MKTEYPFLFSFLYNWAADYILLLFVKKDLYPEIKNRTILIGASACSLSYILWEGTAGKLPPYCRIILKWFLIFSILYILFKIRSVKKIGKTISLFLCYLFLMGGAVSFFLSCIHIKTVGGRKTAWKAMAVIWFSAGVIFLWKMKKKKENATQISKTYTYEVRISRKGRKAVYKGIYDSGNLLVSQITGQGVCIIQKEQAAKLLLTKEKSEIEQIYIQFSEEKEERKEWKKEAANRTAFMENVGKTVSDRNLCTTVFNCWEEKCKNAGSHGRRNCCVKRWGGAYQDKRNAWNQSGGTFRNKRIFRPASK